MYAKRATSEFYVCCKEQQQQQQEHTHIHNELNCQKHARCRPFRADRQTDILCASYAPCTAHAG